MKATFIYNDGFDTRRKLANRVLKALSDYAINSLASGVIMVHNHPSGNPQPSGPDIQITKKIFNF